MLQNDWGSKIEMTKNWLTAASVWKGWRPGFIFHEFFVDQIKSMSEAEGNRGLRLERLEARFDFS